MQRFKQTQPRAQWRQAPRSRLAFSNHDVLPAGEKANQMASESVTPGPESIRMRIIDMDLFE